MPVKPIPEGYHTVTPLLAVNGAERLIDFLKSAFGAVELSRFSSENGVVMHAEMKIGDSIVMMGDAMEEPMPGALYVFVADVDAAYRRALDAGARSLQEPEDQFYGARVARVATLVFGTEVGEIWNAYGPSWRGVVDLKG